MNVIGIVQTDLNEFDILFEPAQGDDGSREGQEGGKDDSGLLDLFGGGREGGGNGGRDGGGNGGRDGGQGGRDGHQDQLKEMTVRIKGIPEGQKATFLQMYQIIQDAKEMSDLERNLTIVSTGSDNQENGGHQGRQNGGK